MSTEPPVITEKTNRAIDAQIGRAVAVTPNDAVDLPGGITRALYVTSEGTLRVTLMDMDDGEFVNYSAIHPGRHPMFVKRVWAAGTSCSSVAEY